MTAPHWRVRAPSLLLVGLLAACSATSSGPIAGGGKKIALPWMGVRLATGIVRADSSTDESPLFTGHVDESGTALAIALVWFLSRNLMLEAAFQDMGELRYDGLYSGTPSQGTVETSGFQLGATTVQPIGDGFEALASGGVLLWDQDEEEDFGGAPIRTSEDGSDPYLGVGLQRGLGGSLTGRLMLERTFSLNGEDYDALTFSLLYVFGSK